MNIFKNLTGDPEYAVEAAGFWLRHQVYGPKRFSWPSKVKRERALTMERPAESQPVSAA